MSNYNPTYYGNNEAWQSNYNAVSYQSYSVPNGYNPDLLSGLLAFLDEDPSELYHFNMSHFDAAFSEAITEPEFAQWLSFFNVDLLRSATREMLEHLKSNYGQINESWAQSWGQRWGEAGIFKDLGSSGGEQYEPPVLEPALPPVTELHHTQVDKLVEMYIGFFGRAVENEGLNYHKDNLLQLLQSGLNEQQAFETVANGFWGAALQYNQITGYTASMSNFDFVSKVYANVLGRPDAAKTDVAGIQGWVSVMKAGQHSQGEMVLKILDGAHDYIRDNPFDPVSKYVDSLLENRKEISLFFAESHVSGSLSGAAAINLGVEVINRIDHTVASVEQVKAALLSDTLSDLPEIKLVGAGMEVSDYGFAV